jgi:hypothetical protein
MFSPTTRCFQHRTFLPTITMPAYRGRRRVIGYYSGMEDAFDMRKVSAPPAPTPDRPSLPHLSVSATPTPAGPIMPRDLSSPLARCPPAPPLPPKRAQALPRDVDKRSVVPLDHPVYPEDLECN